MSDAMLSPGDLAELTAARLAALRVLAVGGEVWTVARRSGDGQTAPTTTAGAGSVTGLLARARPEGLSVTAPGQPAPAITWQFTRIAGAALAPGDELTSADGLTRCRIGSPTAITLTETWEAARL